MYTLSFIHSRKINLFYRGETHFETFQRLNSESDTAQVMGKVQKWIHEKLEKNPGIQDQVKSLFEGLSKDLKNRIKDPEFYQKALTDYIDKTESAIKDLEASKDSEMDPTKKYEIATAIQKTRLAYTKGLMNLTQLHASESGNSALMMSIGHIRADITVAESTIHDDTRNSLKTS